MHPLRLALIQKFTGKPYRKFRTEQLQLEQATRAGSKHWAPYGVYDLTHNDGWVSVGIDHNTAEFAVETIRRWWYHMGRATYPVGTRQVQRVQGKDLRRIPSTCVSFLISDVLITRAFDE